MCRAIRIKKQEKETGISQAIEADAKKSKKKCALLQNASLTPGPRWLYWVPFGVHVRHPS